MMTNAHFQESARAQNLEVCPLCFGCGMEIVKGKGARPCQCAIAAKIKRHIPASLELIPPRYAGFSLDNLTADPSRHKGQAKAIELIKANPTSNFAICGTFGSGKTHLFYSLFRSIVESRRAFAGTLAELIAEHKDRIEADKNGVAPRALSITPEALAQKFTPFSLFIDDIDKETPTEFVCKILFALVNAAYEFGQQMVFTTNLKPSQLIAHFEKADIRFGGSIARRLMDNTQIIKLF